MPPGRISEIANRKRAVTADTALRLARYFGVSPEIWLNLQADYELRVARRNAGKTIETRVRPFKAASQESVLRPPSAGASAVAGASPCAAVRTHSRSTSASAPGPSAPVEAVSPAFPQGETGGSVAASQW